MWLCLKIVPNLTPNFHFLTLDFLDLDSASGRDALNISGASDASSDYMVVQLSSSSDSNSSSNFSSSYNRRDMLDEIEETFNITNFSSINNSFRPTSHGSDGFFSITLDDFRNLTLNNIADDSSSDENNEDDDEDDDDVDATTVHFPDGTDTNPSNATRHWWSNGQTATNRQSHKQN